jgi:arylsulfatase A-like enzyme
MKIVAAIFFLFATAIAHGEKPNVIVILTDDQGWGDLSFSGNENLSTPNIDSLAIDGAFFKRFYVSPVCSPTRAEFLTGRYHQRSGVYSTSAGGERMDLDEVTIADSFKSAGYETAAFGKWHNGMQYPYHPNGRGFEEFYGFCSGHWGNYFSPMLEHNGEIVTGEGFVVDDFTDKAMNFITENKDEPFFVYLPYNTPHSPMQVPDRFWKRFKDKELTRRHREVEKEDELHLRCALAMCENIDWNVGRLLERLDKLGIAENTIVIYFCDNGPNGFRWNGGMKGKKGSTDEGGVRSPMLIRWPAGIESGTEIDVQGSAIDLLPTLTDLAGIGHVGKKPLDGVSLASVLIQNREGSSELIKERMIFSGWKDRFSVRTMRWRLSHDMKLFDMGSDPGQYTNVAQDNRDVYNGLTAKLLAWKETMTAELGEDTRPFVIAHPGHAFTQLPARDATPHGNVVRSNKFPNDSFFSNWISTNDKIIWTAEVAESGKFEVELFYTCDKENIGSTVELSFKGKSLRGEIEKATSTELLGADDDRSPRAESYTQEWQRMTLGEIELEKGHGELVLRASDIARDEVMNFRLLLLKRL